MAKKIILQTKLQPPQIKGRILHRKRLLNTLFNNLDKNLILICADAGYGKTTLLVQLCENLGEPHIFYELDAKDNDTATFFGYLVSGFQKYDPRFGKRVKSIIPQTRDSAIVIGTFINEFVGKFKQHFYIILDDYHHLQKNREIAKHLDYLLKHLPSNLHLIIASRATPPLNLSHYASKQELFIIEKDHLQFDLEEIKILLKDIYKLRIAEQKIIRIAEHSAGWITAVQLILQKICAAGEDKTEETLNRYLASGEEIFNYFAHEVFEHQPKRIQEFLIKTSILEIFNSEICGSLLEVKQSRKMITYLENEHIFVSRIGENFKYHPLFHEFLAKKLRDYHPGKTISELHLKAGNYFLSIKDYSSTVHHFLHAEKYTKAVSILSKQYSHWRYSGKLINYIDLVEHFPKTLIENYPRLLLNKARFQMYLGETAEALKLFKISINRFRRKKDYSGMAEALYLTGLVNLTLMELTKATNFMKRAYRIVEKRKCVEKVETLIGFGSIYRILGKYKKTEMYLKNALKLAKRLKNVKLEITTLRSLADLYWASSDYRLADDIYTEILSKFKENITEFELGKMYGNAALIAVNNNKTKKALDYLSRAEEIAHQYNDLRTITFLLVVRGEFCVYDGNCEEAIELFEKALEMNKRIKEKLLDHYVLVDICDAHIKLGNLSNARSTIRALEPIISAKDSPQSYIEYLLAKGKIETEKGDFAKALDSFSSALRITKRIHQIQQEMNALYDITSYYLRTGQPDQALRHLKRCLNIGQKYNYDTFIILEGKYNIEPLKFAADNLLIPDYLTHILRQINTNQAQHLLNRMSIKRGVYDFECSFFGQLEIRDRSGHIIRPRWRSKRAKSLFILLVANKNKGIMKDNLIDIFWPGKGMRTGSHSLQVEISHVRKVLKKIIRSKTKAEDSILYQDQKYLLNPCLLVKTDIGEFEELMTKANALESINKAKSMQLFQKALMLYKGDFCEDVIKASCEEMRLHYKESALRIFKKLGYYNYKNKKIRRSLELYKKACALDRYDEQIHLGLMRCYAALNNREGVQKQYKYLKKNLRKLGIANPTSEARQIYQESLE